MLQRGGQSHPEVFELRAIAFDNVLTALILDQYLSDQ
jgi:hypothetical protein